MKKCAEWRCFPSTDRFTRCGWGVRRHEGEGGYSNGPADADIESWGTTQQKCHATGWGHDWGPTRIYRLGWSYITTSEIKSVWGKLTKFTTFLCSYPSILQRLNYPDIFLHISCSYTAFWALWLSSFPFWLLTSSENFSLQQNIFALSTKYKSDKCRSSGFLIEEIRSESNIERRVPIFYFIL